MTKKLFVLSCLLFSFIACSERTPLLVEEDIMIDVLRDIHIAEAAMQNLVDLTKDSLGAIYYDQIFQMHQVNKEDFDSTMSILRKDPGRMGIIYDKVIEELEVISDTLFQY